MILTVIGARPQFVKAAAVSHALIKNGIGEDIIHTGQHYDDSMSSIFWTELNIPPYKENLNVGSGSHAKQTAEMMIKIESYLEQYPGRYNGVMVYGDTNSTLASALVASKMGIKLIHIEAGLRSFNRAMPEEINRIVSDKLADILFCSSEAGVKQLKTEGMTTNVFNCGDVMHDAVRTFLPIALQRNNYSYNEIVEDGHYSLLTLHRPYNVDNIQRLVAILKNLSQVPDIILWPVHPRTANQLKSVDIPSNIKLTTPLSYFEMLAALQNSNKVLTDSGGLQKEAYWLKKPCITLRSETEWTETLENNWNTLVKDAAAADAIKKAFLTSIDFKTWKPLYGNGDAAQLITSTLKSLL